MSRFGWAFVNDIVTGSGGNPGGSDKQVQFNSGSTFGGSSNFTYDYATNTLYLTGTLRADSLIVSSSQILKSGSTIFGDDVGDTHQFTGSLYNTTLVSGTTARFTTITGSAYIGGSFAGTTVSGTTAQFGTITATLVTGSSLVVSASVVSASTYLGIPAGVGSTPGGTDTNIQFNSGSTFGGSSNLTFNYINSVLSGTTARFTTITGSTITSTLITGSSLVISASVVSASTYLGISAGATPGGANTYVQFNSGSSLSGSSNLIFDYTTNTLSGTTAQFTTITGSTVTGSTALFDVITGSAYSGGSFNGTSGRFTTFRATGQTTFDAAMAVSGGISVVNSLIRVLTGSTPVASIDNFGVISGSGNMLVGGNLTVAGASTVTHVVSQGSLSAKYQSFTGSFTVPLASWFCGINSSAGAVTASLNLANTYFAGQPITFKDIGGFAATAGKGILIQASGSDKIDGASSLIISAASGSVTVVTDGSSNFFITSIV